MKKRTKRQQAIIRRRIFITCLSLALVLCLSLLGIIISGVFKDDGSVSSSSQSETTQPKEDSSDKIVATATVVNTGDIILHSTVLDGAKNSDGTYDFSAFFKESDDYFKSADLAVANLEVTLAGDSRPYAGYPAFNAPDSLLDVIKNAGINFLLTSNNHCYDTGLDGLKRTVAQLKLSGIDYNGTRENANEPTYVVKDVNGIKIGMVNYTYENTSSGENKSINGNIVKPEANALINSFNYDNLDSFYAEAQTVIDGMKQNGAEAIVFYMHWGEEYQLTQNTWQKTIAQKLCNFGVDVIVGGHPHVVQPMEVLYSEDSQNTTVCIYSMGNAISNQRKELMDSCPSGHTEDGMLFYYTFSKYGDGTVVLSGVDIIPTWVNKYRGGSGHQYTMYPLEDINFANNYGFDAATAEKAKKSFERTKEIISKGLTDCQQMLGCEVRFTELLPNTQPTQYTEQVQNG